MFVLCILFGQSGLTLCQSATSIEYIYDLPRGNQIPASALQHLCCECLPGVEPDYHCNSGQVVMIPIAARRYLRSRFPVPQGRE